MVFQANHGLPASQGGQRGADRGDCFNQTGMHAAVNDSIRLAVVRSDLKFSDNFISSGTDEVNSHGLVPAAGGSVERDGEVSIRSGGEAGSIRHAHILYFEVARAGAQSAAAWLEPLNLNRIALGHGFQRPEPTGMVQSLYSK